MLLPSFRLLQRRQLRPLRPLRQAQQVQRAPSAVLSECEHLILQQEEALKCERQQLEAWKLEVECNALALQLQTSQPQSQAPATQTGPRAEEIDLRGAEVKSVALSNWTRERSVSSTAHWRLGLDYRIIQMGGNREIPGQFFMGGGPKLCYKIFYIP